MTHIAPVTKCGDAINALESNMLKMYLQNFLTESDSLRKTRRISKDKNKVIFFCSKENNPNVPQMETMNEP